MRYGGFGGQQGDGRGQVAASEQGLPGWEPGNPAAIYVAAIRPTR